MLIITFFLLSCVNSESVVQNTCEKYNHKVLNKLSLQLKDDLFLYNKRKDSGIVFRYNIKYCNGKRKDEFFNVVESEVFETVYIEDIYSFIEKGVVCYSYEVKTSYGSFVYLYKMGDFIMFKHEW